ncbi:hypothetical protein [Caloranaerobacter azorensis]|uniref:Uncharacterized protein n=1 Tax=Caloranaerobacter azorensis TaxID=116090 RepID=A0A6P1YEE7_9FIRM|nr:hypothetical protein [Caloranaerobacter azorensis]QIB27524.1 hypothetical protein G3A45_09620 [Caloranaerobacter azorensis]
MNKIGNIERFILLISFSALVLTYSAFGLLQADVNPLLKLLPFLAIGIYILVKKSF